MLAHAEQLPSLLVVDVGNTIAKVAIFRVEELVAVYHTSNVTLDGLGVWAKQYGCTAGILSTVIDLSVIAERALAELPFPPLRLTGNTPLPMQSKYAASKLGTDRVAAVAAVASEQCDLTLIVDLGTCITYDWVLGNCHLGGNIAPGINMRLKAMHDYTSRLPLVEPSGKTVTIGTTTEDAMLAGVLQGICHEIIGYTTQRILNRAISRVLITGGDAHYLEADLKALITHQAPLLEHDANLVLKGLNRILLYNGTY